MQFRGGMSELMRQASRLQRKIEQRKKELAEEKIEADAGGGKVKAIANGAGELVRITIDPKLLESGEDTSMVEDLVVAAANAALTKSKEYVDAELEKVTGGMKIPGMT